MKTTLWLYDQSESNNPESHLLPFAVTLNCDSELVQESDAIVKSNAIT